MNEHNRNGPGGAQAAEDRHETLIRLAGKLRAASDIVEEVAYEWVRMDDCPGVSELILTSGNLMRLRDEVLQLAARPAGPQPSA